MDANFWHQKWERNEIGFHESTVNPALVEQLDRLNLAMGSRIFLPLCGKTRDIAWLIAQGHRIVGVELSSMAVNQLFAELELVPEVTRIGTMTRHRATNIDIWVGDIFDASDEMLGVVDAVYDRAALVALPADMRRHYAAHMTAITNAAPQLLVTYAYDQRSFDGPPFSVREEELKMHYGRHYQLVLLKSDQIAGGLKGKVDASIATWLLQRPKPCM